MKHLTFNSTAKKRLELINAILDSGHIGSAEEWLEARKVDIKKITDYEIDIMTGVLNEIKKNEVKK